MKASHIHLYALFVFALTISSCSTENSKEQSQHHHADADGDKYARLVNNGTIPADTLKGSPPRISMALVDGCHVHIAYSSPGVKGRVIWGGLVPYDELWVTGAHEATTISFNTPVKINGEKLDAGEYAFFTIPGKESWTLIFNRNTKQHLTDEYSPKDDALRVKVVPRKISPAVQRLTYTVMENEDSGGVVTMAWENTEIAFTVTGDTER